MSAVAWSSQDVGVAVERVHGWQVPAPAPGTGLGDSSLIIATYRRPRELVRLVEELAQCEGQRPHSVPGEVVVVDGSPDRQTEQALRSISLATLPFTLKYLRSKPGLTRQRNVGIDASSGRFVFFLDDDAFPAPDYFRVIRNVFLQDTCGAIGAVGGCVVNEWDRALPWRWRVRLATGIVPRMEPMRYAHCGASNPRALLKPYAGVREVDLLSGCAFSFRREVLDCERFSNFFDGYSNGEDMEMSLRVGRRWKLVCAGEAHVVHEQAATGRPLGFAKGRMDVRNRLMIWRRYSAAKASALDKLRLTADFAFLVALDFAAFAGRPWKPQPLLHGWGILWGLAECLYEPPEFDESRHRVRYQAEYAAE